MSVQDSGAGIDPEILPRLFTKFDTKSFEGAGLGLFISKSIIEAHDGKIGLKITQMEKAPRLALVYRYMMSNKKFSYVCKMTFYI